MSDSEWYEGLTASELEGKHVQVTYDEGCVVSGRMVECNGDAVIADGSCDGVGILWRDGDGLKLDKGVRDFRLVWDERDWEEIPIEDVSEADAVVVNGRLIRVKGLYSTNQFRPVDVGVPVPFEYVSCALRRRSKLPTELGAYRGADGTLLILTDISLPNKWVYVSDDYKGCGVFLGDEQAEQYLPLSPVHFVDGRVE